MQIKKITEKFGTKTKAQEILLLLKNAKQVVRHGFYEKELRQIEKFCKQNNLYCVRSKFKVLLTEKDKPYSNKGLRVPETFRTGMFFVYISKDELLAHEAALAEITQDHKTLGTILGYPHCCITNFIQAFKENNTDLQKKPTNPWTNITQRQNDIVILSHFPCSSNCQESITLAQYYHETLKEIDPEHAKIVLTNLETFI
jgi:hypothetical protein